MKRLVSLVVVVALLGPLGVLVSNSTPAGADRTFGDDPLDEVIAAADRHKKCGLTRDKLAAIILAPTFRETGAPTTQAPSPMTLSRWDTQTALYSFESKTPYPNAFWHPGIGPWQFDDAGYWGLIASQRIDTAFIADFAAQYMADRWCDSPSFSTVWAPWFGCNGGACSEVYNEIYQDGHLTNLDRASGVGNLGGMVKRTCTNGGATTFTCWFVDPSKAQGYAGFAIPGAGPAPITKPFYVYAAGGKEVRHWLSEHSGYSIDIQASLPLGKNSRTDLTWKSGSSLCDLTTGTGLCDPTPPAGFSLTPRTVGGTYEPFTGDFNGDGNDDVFWYGPGNNGDSLWYGTSGGSFVAENTKVSGNYDPVVGDFDDDGRDDILWYGSGNNPDGLWYGRTKGFVSGSVKVSGTYTPIGGDFDNDGRGDVFWYGPGVNPDSMWFGRTRGFVSGSVKVSGNYTPLSANFDGNKGDDIFWYGPGADDDSLWLSTGSGGFTSKNVTVTGEYEPLAGDFSGNGIGDVLWYGEGEDPDRLWYGKGGGTFASRSAAVDEVYQPFAGDFDGRRGVDVFWYRPGDDYDAIWYAT